MASLQYVTAGWLRSRNLMVASLGAGQGPWRLVPSALAPSGRGTGPRGRFVGWWALG